MDRINIVLIILDTCRYDCWMEILARGSLREANKFIIFHNAFSTATWTPPSHASIFTGKYPHQHGVLADRDTVPPLKEPGLAYKLRRLGYYTYALTSNTVVTPFLGGGFLRVIEIHTKRGELIPIKYLRSVFDPPNRFVKLIRKVIRIGYYLMKGAIPLGQKYYKSLIINQTIAELLKRGFLKEPFFLFINYMDTHDYLYYVGILNRLRIEVTQRKDLLHKVYNKAIERLVSTLNELLCILEEWGLLDRTIIIITSDHGELLGEYGLVGHAHAYPYNELIHVPLMIYDPYEQRGGEVTKIFSIKDIYGFMLKRIIYGKSIIEYANELPDYVIVEDRSLGIKSFKHYRCVIKPPVKVILDIINNNLDVKVIRLKGYSNTSVEESLSDTIKILHKISIEAEIYKRLRSLRRKLQI